MKGAVAKIELGRYRVNLAPLRSGAGIKGKIAEGWAFGTPAVTTPVGAEGMHGLFPFGGVVAQSNQTFVESAYRLYQDESSWQLNSRQGVELIKKLYNPSQTSEALMTHLERSCRELITLRQKNMMGRILNHQSMRATEYFSRWIQTKQKLKDQAL
jgi:glycosyltransferase involved in cell wall biosynthesis